MKVKLSNGRSIPIEMHKVRIVQKTTLPPIRQRLRAMEEAGYNTFLLRTRDLFIDMLTDSGTNAMSDNQLASMMVSDDAYAGGESYYKMLDAVKDVLGFEYCVPVHQGRAAEHLLAKIFVKPGGVVPMNYHFTTTKAHFEMALGKVLEIYREDALQTESTNPFKGNLDLDKFQKVIDEYGADRVSFVRMEATTNLIGGQPFSLENLCGVRKIAEKHGIPVIIDCSLISENAYFIQQREAGYADKTIAEIVLEMMSHADLIYLSGRKSTCVRGGLIATKHKKYFDQLVAWLPVYEGFITYGGMSSKEIEAMAVGLREMVDPDIASSSADLIEYFVNQMVQRGIPAVTPPGGLAGHVDAMKFLPHIPQSQYPAGAMAAALFLASGVRSMERGTISMDRDEQGNDVLSDVELCRMAVPRRVYSMSHIDYVVDRLEWLLHHRDLVGGLEFYHEPPVLRFFTGKLKTLDNWGSRLADAFAADFGENY
ncbi:MAG: tryptophanase [Candidatus Anammoximicrobium sp.]|nr:tryptophanase [Candidatus Anammoximicrobium sp.]